MADHPNPNSPGETPDKNPPRDQNPLGSDPGQGGASKASSALFVAAALLFIWSIITIVTNHSYIREVMLLHLLEAGMLTILGFLARRKPFTSMLTGLLLFVALWIVTAAMDKTNIYSGMIVKIFVIIYILRAMPDARRFEKGK